MDVSPDETILIEYWFSSEYCSLIWINHFSNESSLIWLNFATSNGTNKKYFRISGTIFRCVKRNFSTWTKLTYNSQINAMISRWRVLEVNSTAVNLWMRSKVKRIIRSCQKSVGSGKCKYVKYSRLRRRVVRYLHLKSLALRLLENKLAAQTHSCQTSRVLLRTPFHGRQNCNNNKERGI